MDADRKARLTRINNARAARDATTAQFSAIVTNLMLTRAGLAEKLFDPRRSIDEECGYPTAAITCEQYRRMYDRELGRRVVDVYPAETWKRFPNIFEDPDADKDTPFEDALDKLNRRLHLLHYLQRVDELSGVGSYGVVLWGLDDGRSLADPVDGFEAWGESTGILPTDVGTGTGRTRRLLYVRVLDESLAKIAAYNKDAGSPRYGLPESYTLTLMDPSRTGTGDVTTAPDLKSATVHWSRVTHVADNRKTSEVFGTPRMEPVWNRLYDLCKVLGGSGEMFWRGGFPGISLETQKGLENAVFDNDATQEQMFKYMNGLQRYLQLVGVNAKSLAPQIAAPTPFFEVQIKAICVTLGVPYRVFMGVEEGVVSGDQATRAWEGRLANRQARYVTPMLIDPVLQRLVDYGVLPSTAMPLGWSVEWPSAMEPTEQERAETADKLTGALARYISGGVDTLVPPLEFLTLVCGLDDPTARAIVDAALEHIASIEGDEVVASRLPTPEPLQDVGAGVGEEMPPEGAV